MPRTSLSCTGVFKATQYLRHGIISTLVSHTQPYAESQVPAPERVVRISSSQRPTKSSVARDLTAGGYL